jgi:steroid delta-isomerase-like uncharacterized protein
MRITMIALTLVSLGALACEDKSEGTTPAPTASAAAALPTASATAQEKPKTSMGDMQTASNKARAEAFNSHDAAKAALTYAATAVVKAWGIPDVVGREAITNDYKQIYAGYPDIKLGFSRVWQNGNVEVAEWTVTGTNGGPWQGKPATSRPVGFKGASVYTFGEDGLIKEERRYYDMTTIQNQLDPKAKAGTFRPVETTIPTSTETHVAKDDPGLLESANKAYAAFDNHKLDDVLAFCTDDYWNDDVTQPANVKGKKAVKDLFNGFLAAMPDMHFTNTQRFASDGYVFWEGTINGTQKGPMGPIKATNKPVTMHFIDIHQFKDGKFVSTVSYANNLEVLEEIGVVPPPGAAASGAAATAAPKPTMMAPAPTAAPKP